MAPQADGHPRQRACPPHHPTPPHPTPLHPNARSQVLKTAEHPGPLTEIDFWTSKRNNLRSIQEQLQGDKIRKVVRVLDLTKSTYFPAFSRLCKEVNSACAEAADNAKFLETLRETFTQLEQKKNGAFAELPDLFRPIMMRLLLVWKNSAHYNTPARLVVLVREVCNELIAAARSFLDSEQIFQLDPSEALERFTLTLKVCGLFKSTYFDFKATSATEVPDNPWKIQNAALFPRLDAFLERCHDLLDLFRTVVQFRKLEKIEIGGNKGRTLSASVVQIYSDFNGLLDVILHLPYDVLDVDVKQFDDDFYSFRASIKELERRLGSVLNQGFEDCATVFSAFKLIESFEGLLEREFIQADLERRQADLLRAYASDLKDVSEIFHRQRATSAAGKYLEREGPPLYVNMPPVAGALFWVRGLIERIEGPMAQLKATMRLMLETEEAKDVTKTYAGLLAGLRDFEATQYEAWGAGVEEISQSKLKQPLLTRDDETLLLHVNFDPALVRLLREVTYFKMLDKDIPKPAAELSEKNETFRVQMGNLQLVAGMYNQMLLTMLDVERPLLAANLKAIDEALAKGLKHLTWKSHAIDDFIRDAMTLVRESHGKLTVLKDNMRSIEAILTNWASNPLIKRKSSKTYNTAEFTAEQATHLQQRYAEVNEGGKEIHKLLLTSNRELKVSKGAPAWRVYVEFVNDIVVDGLARTVSNSLAVVCEQVDAANIAKNELVPWLEVQLELMPPEVQFQPPLGEASGDASVQATVNVWIASFFKTCHIVKRLDRADGDFLSEVAENEDVRFFVHAIHQHIRANEDECNAFREPFVAHEELWTVDINQSLKDFIASGPEMLAALAGETAEAAEGAVDGSPRVAAPAADGALVEADTARARLRREPPLTAYDEKISHYKALQDAVATMPVSATRGWLKVDARPAKQALSTWVTKWMFAYTQHLQETIQSCLAELEEFMRDVRAGLGADVETNNVAQLTAAMWHLRSMKKSNDEVDDLFEPLRGMVGLLRKYAIAVPDATVDWLHKAPYEWEDTKKLGYVARERLAPLQSMQAEIIRQEAEIFAKRVEAFVATFKKGSPYTYELGQDTAYDMIDAMQLEIVAIEADAAKISEREALFDLTNHNWRELRMCRTELEQLKTVWDHVVLVEHVFNSYRSVLWARVDCDLYYAATIKIQKQAKLLERTIRPVVGWGVYVGLSATIADMLVALPLVQDLKDEAMRERHWKKLMRICGRNFTMDEKFCLNDLLKLQLHLYADGVSECTEQARQELKIDKQINKIDATWMGLQTEYVPFKNTGVYIINEVSLGGVYEALDENELVLQGMMGNRFMGFFETQIVGWKSKLATVRATLDSWVEVQRAWCSLEAIFIGSEDIREQLPEDAKRFDTVDADFKEQMADAKMQPSPVQACLKEGRMDAMKKCQAGLDLCQKSLSDYLETKRKKFPRFYFISSADLVDVLSKGRNPPAVQEHFSKFTDNIGAIQWKLDDDVPTGTALGMVSGDGEEVRFPGPHTCDGPVEDWLKELMEHVQESLREKLLESVNSYVELPRDKWLGETCAQNSITTSQIWWTTEVGSAFERLEQGNEGALKDYAAQVVTGLNSLTTMVLGELTKGDRTKIKTLITIEVHARDIVNRLVSEKVENALSFAWQSQLKYRWDEEVKDCFVNIADAEFKYSYEYVGNPGRLVITALTDRCYITLTQAMRLVLGGAPAGPAGTGKTETTKDLAKALAKQCVVFNCQEGLDYIAMGKFFRGLAMSGAWACFDEFNRIDLEVLSVVAQQVSSIQQAMAAGLTRFEFEGNDIPLDLANAVFITMNPGYAGRSELPDNLKALFRPVACMVPDYALIAEIRLYSFGYKDARRLSQKMVATFRFASEQVSSQDHYDFGMRAVNTVIQAAGNNRAAAGGEAVEDLLVLSALADSNRPKFLAEDMLLFNGILSDLFPGQIVPTPDYTDLTDRIKEHCAKNHLIPTEQFIFRCIQIYEVSVLRHGFMTVGPTGGAKTSAKNMLLDAMADLDPAVNPEGGDEKYSYTRQWIINPKAITMGQLYGEFDENTHEWTDGILCVLYRAAVKEFSEFGKTSRQWLIFDGPVDALWIESMNTVLDDNRKLCLVSGEIITMSPYMSMVFEVEDLAVASPATVSRVGTIYMEPDKIVGVEAQVLSYLMGLPDEVRAHEETLRSMLLGLMDTDAGAVEFTRKKTKEYLGTVDNNLVASTLALLHQFWTQFVPIDGAYEVPPELAEALPSLVERFVLFAVLWGAGGALDAKSRLKFDAFLRAKLAEIGKADAVGAPAEGLLYDYSIAVPSGAWTGWMETVPPFELSPKTEFADIIVPTIDSVRYMWIVEQLCVHSKHVLAVGPTGTGKTLNLVAKLMTGMPDKFAPVFLGFSAQTSANQTQDLLDAKMDKRRKGIYGPPAGKKFLVFVDDVNMPQRELYGAQPPIEILRQWMGHGGWYDRKLMEFRKIIDISFLGALGPPGGGRQVVTDRFLRYFNFVSFPEMDDAAMMQIFQMILHTFVVNYLPEDLVEIVTPMVSATIDLYNVVGKELLPTPAKPHYTFNLRDVASVIQGVLSASQKEINTREDLIRLWAHENMRVYRDRLVDNHDRSWFDDLEKRLVPKYFAKEWGDVVKVEVTHLIYGDFMVPGADPKLYSEITDTAKMVSVVEEQLEDYNSTHTKKMPLVMFVDAVGHVARMSRVIRQPLGNSLLLGVGGSGRQSLARLSAAMAEYDCFQIEIAKNYGKAEWRDDIKKALLIAGEEGKPLVFLFADTQIVKESFLEDINNILNSGEVPNLFDDNELNSITAAMRPIAQAAGLPLTKVALYSVFVKRVRRNIHMALCMSPLGSEFPARLRNFPSLVNNCTIDFFAPWPEEALRSVAFTALDGIDLGSDEVKEGIVTTCGIIHQTVETESMRYLREQRRYNYVTPTSYLELLSTFKTLLKFKRDQVLTAKKRLVIGLDKLGSTEVEVDQLKTHLEEMQPVLIKTSGEVEEMMKVIEKDKEAAAETQATVAKEEEIASTKAEQCQQIKDSAEHDLAEALPALDAAVAVLRNLKLSDISEVAKYANPPGGVKLVMEAMCVLKGVPPKMVGAAGQKTADYWEPGKKMLGDAKGLLDSMFNFDKDNIPEKIVKNIQPYIESEDFQPKKIEAVSKSCTAMCQWVRAMDKYHHVAKEVEPKRLALKQSQEELDVLTQRLNKLRAELKEVEDKIADLESKFNDAVAKKEELAAKVADATVKMDRAGRLLGGLGGEKTRWIATVESLTQEEANLVGDVCVAAGSVAYLGPFISAYRQGCEREWVGSLRTAEVPGSATATLAQVMDDKVKLRAWQVHGLPADLVSTENGIILANSRRWALAIDPQGQANKWIRNMEGDNGVEICKPSDKDFLRTLENAVRFGKPVIMENVASTLDPSLEPVLLKQTFKQGGNEVMKIGDNTIPYHADFKFYLTTKLPNPHYAPEVAVKVTLLNFTITQEGLEDQLLGITVAKERPDLEETKNNLIIQSAKMAAQLKDIESNILKLLSESTGNILDDEGLINTLAQSKVTSNEIAVKAEEARATELTIDQTRNEYRPVAFRGALLFFCVADMGQVDPMYQYSMPWFTSLFMKAIDESEKSDEIAERLVNLNDYFSYSLYLNICRSLFEAHKLLFSFMVCIKVMQGDNLIDPDEWRFFLSGTSGSRIEMQNPAPEWLTSAVWSALCSLDKLPAFGGVAGSVAANLPGWRDYFDSNEPHNHQLPGEWDAKLNMLQKLCVLRCVRGDKVVPGMQNFVSANIGERFIEPPAFEIGKCFKDASNVMPIVFVLTSGADPFEALMKFAEEMKFGKKLVPVSLGQGQGPIAEKQMNQAMERGTWVLLQNCHLASSWMPRLEAVIEQYDPDTMHRDYRLWLTSMPSTIFPVSILQNSVKITNEPPRGVKANLNVCYLNYTDAYLESSPKPTEFKKCLFAVCFFHALLQDRRKFGPIGFNIGYEFTTSDMKCCVLQLEVMMGKYDQVPYKVMQNLICHINYGGRITDDWDRRMVMTLLLGVFNEGIEEDGFPLAPGEAYGSPPAGNIQAYRDVISTIPLNPHPNVFGLHENADIACAQAETTMLCEIMLGLQAKASSGGGKSRDDVIREVAQGLQERNIAPFDLDAVTKKYPLAYEESMNTVLAQECQRYNALIEVFVKSLSDVLKALKGLVVMSSDLEALAESLYTNQVPELWEKKAYPSLKPLAAWIDDLVERIRFISDWITNGKPSSYWISGFFFPQAFLTGTLQNYARKYVVSIDTVSFDFNILKKDKDEVLSGAAPPDGCYIHGLFLEGAAWDADQHTLVEARPKELYSVFPPIWLNPKVDRPNPTEGVYSCPVYKTLRRAGTLSTTGHSTNFVLMCELPSQEPCSGLFTRYVETFSSHWIKRAVALFCALNY